MASSPITLWQIGGETMETVRDFILGGSKITAGGECSHKIKRHLLTPWEKSYDQPRQHIKKQRCYFADKGPSSQSYDFFSSHVRMWELDYKDSWVPKNSCFWTDLMDQWYWRWICGIGDGSVVLEKTLESPSDSKEIQPVLKGNQSDWKDWCWSRNSQYFGHLIRLIGKDPDAGKDWRQEKKGTTEDEIVGWHHQLQGHEFEQALGVGDGQGSLECCSPWGCKELDTTEWLNWTVYVNEATFRNR